LVSVIAIAVISYFQPSFLTPFNIFVLLSAIAVNMLVALGQLVIIGVGQMNLALGSIGGLVAISFGAMMELWGFPPVAAIICGLLIGAAAGMASGVVIARTGISAFIITLAGLQIFKGINLGITEAQPFYGIPQGVKDFGSLSIIGPIPWLIVPTVIASIAVWLLFSRLRIGRYILAIGGNRNGHPTIGDDWLISSFAAPVIGGAILAGGHVSVPGTFFGVVIIAIITQALVVFAIDPFVVQIVLGGLILWAVGINRLREVRVAKLLGQKV
jgi:ribose transport system permease protein